MAKPKKAAPVKKSTTGSEASGGTKLFFQIPLELAKRKDLPPGAKLVYGYLKNLERLALVQRRPEDVILRPRQTIIAEACGFSRKHAGHCLRTLEEVGLIVRTRKGYGAPTIYTFTDQTT